MLQHAALSFGRRPAMAAHRRYEKRRAAGLPHRVHHLPHQHRDIGYASAAYGYRNRVSRRNPRQHSGVIHGRSGGGSRIRNFRGVKMLAYLNHARQRSPADQLCNHIHCKNLPVFLQCPRYARVVRSINFIIPCRMEMRNRSNRIFCQAGWFWLSIPHENIAAIRSDSFIVFFRFRRIANLGTPCYTLHEQKFVNEQMSKCILNVATAEQMIAIFAERNE
jgi:hypothetical protein